MTSPVTVDGCDTPAKLLRARALARPGEVVLRHKQFGVWRSITWGEWYERVKWCGLAFRRLGLPRGAVVAVLSESCPEVSCAEFGAQSTGMVACTVSPRLPPDAVARVLLESDARIVITGALTQLATVLALRDQLPRLQTIVVIDPKGMRRIADHSVIEFDALLGFGREFPDDLVFERLVDDGGPEDLCCLDWSDDQAGASGCVPVANREHMRFVQRAVGVAADARGDRVIACLPPGSVSGRVVTALRPLGCGSVMHFVERAQSLSTDLREAAPQTVFGTPRFWERMQGDIELRMGDATRPARDLYERACAVGDQMAQVQQAGIPVPMGLLWQARALRSTVLVNVLGHLGLRRVCDALVCDGSVAPELVRWYAALGIALREVRFNDDEGHGRSTAPDQDGACITATGRRIDARDLERRLRVSPWVDDAMIIGAGRPFVSCLVLPDLDHLARYARARRIAFDTPEGLARLPAVHARISDDIARLNRQLATHDRIHGFRIIDRVLSPQSGELTPDLRLNRPVVRRTCAPLIASIYPES